ncbi:hypothetical protein FACS1894167_09330 [Synergistales bacterium]|nr:hypothetical protein FACS1894167_09330 [Synergistales bacterium]
MIKMLVAYTNEIDDADAAVSEVLGQLEPERNLLNNSVGMAFFYSEFLETGVVKALSDALPFDVIGCTTSNVAIPGVMGDTALVLAVLTSDDVTFRAGMSEPMQGGAREPVKELYSRLAPPLYEKPALLLTLAPVIQNVSGDDIIDALDSASGGVPVFGSLAFTHLSDFSGIYTSFNGEASSGALTLIALYGDVKPEFFRTPTPEERVVLNKAVITRSVGNEVWEINGQNTIDYLESIGIGTQGNAAGMSSIPLVVTLKDGSRVVRSPYKILDNGHISFYGAAPEGSEVGFSNFEMDFVTTSARDTLKAAAENSESGNILLFSCAARKWTLGAFFLDEMKEVAGCLDESFKYQLAYSGGEICPVRNDKGELVNRFHNYTMIGCIF